MNDAQALSPSDYPDPTEVVRLSVSGMHCGSCVSRVETILNEQPGVLDSSVNLANQIATVTTKSGQASPDLLGEALTRAGYASEPELSRDATDTRAIEQDQTSRRNLWLAIGLTLPVFVLEMGSHFSPGFTQWVNATIGIQTSRWLQLVLSAIVLFVAGREFFQIGITALLRRAPEMNSLVAIGAFSAWTFSAINTVMPERFWAGQTDVYFESAAVIVSLILLGRYLEAKARGKTSQAITALADLQPDTAWLDRDGVVSEVPIESLNTGDSILIKPGERIAIDGTIASGSSRINESMLTGEPMPVRRVTGDSVTGGTLNTDGALTITVSATGSDTVLARIIAHVQSAQSAKLPIQSLVDKVAMWFVPAVLLIAALTFAVWYFSLAGENRFGTALIYAVSVLIIACPCAMGLATPLSVMVGIGRAAKTGILFRNGQALQQLGQTELIAFDKTGTLTVGEPVLTDVIPCGNFTEQQLLSLVASVQSQSEHPIATAVVDAAKQRSVQLLKTTNFSASAGLGVSAIVEGQIVKAGNQRFLEQNGVETSELIALLGETPGLTAFMIAVDQQAAGVMKMSDKLREETVPTLKSLRQLGLDIAVISGDRGAAVVALAEKLGIDQAIGDVLPAQKQQQIKQLGNAGKQIAFVGDGINDAPALAEAQVGIAIGGGTDVAIESADLVLASSDLSAVVRGILLSRATMRNIKQNLFWAFIYNLMLIPVAAGVLMPVFGISLSPMLAAAAMSLSSIFVALNALRLNKITIEPKGQPVL